MDKTYALQQDNHSFFENIERSCRNCKHFLRIQRHDEASQHALRGICYLGCPSFNEPGDYRLYISCSGAKDCTAFIIDQRKAELTAFERKLALSFNDYMEKEEPRMQRQVRKIQREMMKKENTRTRRMRWTMAEFLEVRSRLAQEWRSANYRLLGYIHDNYDLKFAEYLQILDAFASFNIRYVEKHPSHALTESSIGGKTK